MRQKHGLPAVHHNIIIDSDAHMSEPAEFWQRAHAKLATATGAKMTDSRVKRREFLKASLVAGAAGIAAPLAARTAQERGNRPATSPPSSGMAAAESLSVETHPRAEATGAELIMDPGSDFMVEVLQANGIRYVAATAGSSFRGLHESVVNHAAEDELQLIVCVHEEISAAFAHGYAKVSGETMACLLHSTVGIQHASMAIYNAYCDRAPLMVIVGNILDATQRRPGVEWVHTAEDVAACVRDFVKWDDTPVSLQHFAESFSRACEIARTPPCEPVLIVADAELQEKQIEDRANLSIPHRAPVAPAGADQTALTKVADLLLEAERPVLVVDRVARSQRGVELLVELAELVNSPVIDQGGRMNMPNTHYLCQTSAGRMLIGSADVIVGLELADIYGTVNSFFDLTERVGKPIIAADAKVVGISAKYGYIKSNIQDIQRYFPAHVTMDADAETMLPQLICSIRSRMTARQSSVIAARTADLRRSYAAMRSADANAAAIGWVASPISTARMAMELWEQIKDLDWALVSGTILASSWPQRLWDIEKHYQYIGDSGGWGLGYTAPAAAGAALAHRDAGRIPVSIQGDGDLMMLPGTLWTLAHHRIPLLMMMHNNRAWHQETMHLQRMTNRRNRKADRWRIGTVIEDPYINFAELAQSMGVWAEGPISDPTRLAPAIARALKVVKLGKPALLDVLTQPR